MNMIEQQMNMGRKMMELNAEWAKSIAEFETSNIQKFVELNQEFAQKLPEVSDVQSFMDFQRQYSEQLWEGTQDVMRHRGEMMTQAVTQQSDLIREAFSSTIDAAPAKKTTRRAKAAA